MRDLPTLRELVKSVKDCDTLVKMSGKPFKPNFFDVIMLYHSPQFYNVEQQLQVSNSFKLHATLDPTPITRRLTEKRKFEEIPQEKCVGSEPEKSKKKIKTSNKSIPDLPTKFRNRINELNGCNIKFVMHKTFFASDTKPLSNRLSMPINKIVSDFLTKDEIQTLNGRDNTNGKGQPIGIKVTVLDPDLREFTLPLKKWGMERTYTYNLIKNWSHIVSANAFEEKQEIQIWSFRVESKLYIILHKL